MKVYNRRRGLEMGGLMRIRKNNDKHLSDSSVNHKQKKSLIAQVEQDHLGDSFIYRVRSNIANMLHIGRSRRTRHAGSVVRILVIALVMLLTLSQAGPFFADLSGVPINDVSANAEPMNRTGYIKTGTANIRSGTSFLNNIVAELTQNHQVTVISKLRGEYSKSYFSDVWYEVSFTHNGTTKTGYVIGNLVMLNPIDPAIMHADFEQYLTLNGYPESYKPLLRELHAKYPNWVFEAFHTNFEWQTAIDNQDTGGKNLIEYYFNEAWRSQVSKTVNGQEIVYEWNTNRWINHDGGSNKYNPKGWFVVSRDLLSYYVDPRNGLAPNSEGKNTAIFQFLRLDRYNANSGENSIGVQAILNGTFMQDQSFGNSFITAAGMTIKNSTGFGINPYHLASRSKIELGTNGSASVRGTFSADRLKFGINISDDKNYDGYYNFYNIGANNDTTRELENIKNGLRYAKYGNNRYAEPPYVSQADADNLLIPWNTRERAIAGGANFISRNYVDKLQNTVYYQKFNVINCIGNDNYFAHQYMGAVMAPTSESSIMYKAYESAGTMQSATLYFSIPVYLNMPDTPSPLPAQTGNPNNWISTVNINGVDTTPSFNPAVTNGYSMVFEGEVNVAKVSIGLVSNKSSSTINGVAGLTADIPLGIGRNVVQISVTAENGSTRVYDIEIVRKDPGETPILLSQNLTINQQQVSGVPVANTAGALKQQLQSSRPEYQIAITKPNGTPYSDEELVGTGAVVQFILNGYQSSNQYTLIIFGDVNGDAEINIADVTSAFRHVMKRDELSSYKLSASDVNKDGETNIADVSIVFRHVMGRSNIVQ